MREKRRKIPLEVILATPVSEARRKHGQQVYASRLCHRGQYEEAKAYCVKNSLPWPPFTGVPVAPLSPAYSEARASTEKAIVNEIVESLSAPTLTVVPGTSGIAGMWMGQPLSDGAREAGPVVREEATPPELASCGEKAPSDPFAGAANGAVGEPRTSVRNGSDMLHETRAPALRKAKVWARCANKRLLKIKFLDGKEEFGSMWNYRTGYRINDILEVELDKTSGSSAIWQEKRRPV